MNRSRSFTQRALAPGARIELVAPAGPFDIAEFEAGVERLRRHYDVHFAPDILERRGYFAGDDARRLAELQRALAQSDVAAIIAARGGYGATRILPALDPALVRRRAPLLIGFSDITALHALWARAEVGSLHGSMVAGVGRMSEAHFDRYRAALEGHFPARIANLQPIAPGCAEGVLLGGNLAVLSALLGTRAFPPLEGAVLFLEDVGERPYRVDRMLTSLRQAGVLAGLAGVALGAFTNGEPGPDGVRIEDVLRERLGDLGVPVVAGVPAGHVEDNLELPLGRWVSLDAANGCMYLEPRRDA